MKKRIDEEFKILQAHRMKDVFEPMIAKSPCVYTSKGHLELEEINNLLLSDG
jgi:hypothetical protein